MFTAFPDAVLQQIALPMLDGTDSVIEDDAESDSESVRERGVGQP